MYTTVNNFPQICVQWIGSRVNGFVKKLPKKLKIAKKEPNPFLSKTLYIFVFKLI
jgi:hypothetical protein